MINGTVYRSRKVGYDDEEKTNVVTNFGSA